MIASTGFNAHYFRYEMDKRCLTYQNLAKYIQGDEKLDFLHAVVPEKITVREYKKILAAEQERNMGGSGSEDSTSESSGSEEASDEEESADDEEEEESPVKK